MTNQNNYGFTERKKGASLCLALGFSFPNMSIVH
jgi:hypothetical protein